MMEAPNLIINFKPSFHSEELLAKLLQTRKREPLMERAKQAWKLSDGAYALLRSREVSDPRELANLAKSFPISLAGPRPLAEAISSAGGIDWKELDETLMIKRYPGLFAAGEMLDWEAPTGGYLMQGCLATGTRAGKGAAAWLRSFRPS
jgi:predicted flavoprotein YhiN